MDTQGQFGFKELFTHVIGDMAKALCERFGESKQQQFVRVQAATHMILGLKPRDVIEAMLAGQTVMFHALMTDSIHDTLQGQVDVMRRPTRANIVAINKAFHMNLDKLEHYHARPSQGIREASGEAQKTAAQGTTATADRTPRPAEAHAAQTQAGASQTPPARPETMPPRPPHAATPAPFRPSPEQIAACRANPEAMAALEAGDADRFARALGVDQPSEAYLAAAAGLPVGTSANARPVGDQPSQPATNRPGGIIR
jgi:hypothetical protein